jgi:CubicO group peptidase (beta-lactamase class C family)
MLAQLLGGSMRFIPGVILALVLLGTTRLSATPPQSRDPAGRQIDAIFSDITQPDAPGLAVLVKRGGKVIFEKGYGVRDLRSRAQNDAVSNFRLASFTKQFTAMAIMLLVHDGKLHYDDHLTDIFPEFPAYGKAITVRNLLTHTGGLLDYESIMEQEEKANGPMWTAEHQVQDEEVLKLLEKQTAGKFAPGTSWSYSNSGYVVLGLIVAKASGMPYRDFLNKRIFDPAGMQQSIVYQKGLNEISNRAYGHTKHEDKFVETDQSPFSATLGDGGIYSNIDDLAKWDEALQKHALLSEKEMAPALTPARLADGSETLWPKEIGGNTQGAGDPVSYGFGWFLDPYKGHPRMYHAGGSMGFRTIIQRFTADGLTVVILCNRLDLDPGALSERVADLFLSGKS